MQRRHILALTAATAIMGMGAVPSLPAEGTPPNVIFIMADDIGLGDVGFYHRERTGEDPVIPTPNLDALVEQGMRFNHAHAEALCAPTRYAVMTGNYTFRCYRPWGVWGASSPSAIGTGQKTLGRMMQEAGYTTGFFGKWHLGGSWYRQGTDEIYDGPAFGEEADQVDHARGYVDGGPGSLGFDYSITLPSGIQGRPFAYFENDKWMKLGEDSEMRPLDWREIPEGSKLGGGAGAKIGDSNYDSRQAGPTLTRKAIEFIEDNKDDPFFITFWSQAVHHPHTPPDVFFDYPVAGETHSDLGDMVLEFDLQVGVIVDKLKEEGLWENTLLIVTSDNGGLSLEDTDIDGHLSNNALRDKKGSAYEGGHRVPLIATWPGRIAPGTESNERILLPDVMATLYDLTGRDTPSDQARDSLSFLPLLLGKADAPARTHALITNGRLYEDREVSNDFEEAIVVYEGDMKLIAAWDNPKWGNRKEDFMTDTISPVALFDLSTNPHEEEERNLVDDPAQEARVARMVQTFHDFRETEGTGRTTPTARHRAKAAQ